MPHPKHADINVNVNASIYYYEYPQVDVALILPKLRVYALKFSKNTEKFLQKLERDLVTVCHTPDPSLEKAKLA